MTGNENSEVHVELIVLRLNLVSVLVKAISSLNTGS